MKKCPLITVFTPTYNREKTLIRTYQSLEKQSFKDFEWVIVDDGSTDNTRDLVNTLIKRGSIEIRYFYKENGGKHTAHNLGVEKARGEFFFNVDSDDWLPKHSLEKIATYVNILRVNHGLGGLIALKELSNRKLLGCRYPKNISMAHFQELDEMGYGGERSLVFKTDVLKHYPFPIIPIEKFMTEGVIYQRIDRDYQFFVSNEILTICEYQDNGLSYNPKKLMVTNPGGYKIYYRERLDTIKNLLLKIGVLVRYVAFEKMSCGRGIRSYNGRYKLVVLLIRPFASIIVKKYFKAANR